MNVPFDTTAADIARRSARARTPAMELHIEAFEARVLFSADLVLGGMDSPVTEVRTVADPSAVPLPGPALQATPSQAA
ncbi:MAG: LEPR-XLL domain-containing protein, partial [Burkholderiaceae bacterium]